VNLYVSYVGIIDDWFGWRRFSEAAHSTDLSNATED
jgi:hypothetical protein